MFKCDIWRDWEQTEQSVCDKLFSLIFFCLRRWKLKKKMKTENTGLSCVYQVGCIFDFIIELLYAFPE